MDKPAICGEAIEVPLMFAILNAVSPYAPSVNLLVLLVALKIFTPGAYTSTPGPFSLNSAICSLLSVSNWLSIAPTIIALLLYGEEPL